MSAANPDYIGSPHPLHDPDGIYAPRPPKEGKPKVNDAQAREKVKKLLGVWREVVDEQAEFRQEMRRDEQFYDGVQWTEEDIAIMEERHQVPLVFNHIKPSIDWLLGTERKTRIDFRVLPRESSDEDLAEIKSKLIKYVHDMNRAQWARSLAFRDAVKVGIGWLEDGVRADAGDDPLFSRHESWRNLWWDHLAKEPDFSDARFIFRMKYLDVDIAKAMFPEFEEQIERAARTYDQMATDDEDTGWESTPTGLRRGASPDSMESSKRRRVRMLECWYKVPTSIKVFRSYLPNVPSDDYAADERQQQLLDEGLGSLHDAIKMRVRVAMLLPDAEFLLSDQRSPYKHNEFPFTAILGFRRAEDGAPYGVVRQCESAQYDLNKRASKALFILSTNQVVAEEGAVDDWDQLADEVAAPDGVITYKRGFKLEFRSDKALAESHLNLLDRDRAYIQDISGVTNENMGRDTNAESGRAVIAKQTQGAVVTYELFDNLRFACQVQGEKQLQLIEQFYDMPKQVRIIGDDGGVEWLQLNDPTYEDDGSLRIINDIAATKADFIVDIQDFHASARQALSAQLMELAGQMPPELAMPIVIRAVDLMDIPKKSEIVADLRRALGMPDPDKELTPEEMMQQQAEQQRQQQQEQRQFEAEVGSKEAVAMLKRAQAERTRVQTQQAALGAANELGASPFESVPMADQVLREAGFGLINDT
jgi:hypothetical protein